MAIENNQSAHGNIPSLENATPLTVSPERTDSVSGIENNSDVKKKVIEEIEIKLNYAEEIHQYIRGYIQTADQKAAFFFATFAALLTYQNSNGYLTIWISNPKMWDFVQFFAFLSSVGFLISTILCIFVVIPRLKGTKRGIIYFNAIIEYSSQQEYAQDVLSQIPNKLCEEKLKHAYELAQICSKKYKVLHYVLLIGGISFFVMILLLIIAN